jgi:Zn-dependent hydrolases, including glyoxylases
MFQSTRIGFVVSFAVFVLAITACAVTAERSFHTHRPELEYLKAVNSVGPARDPQIIFLLVAQYANANQHEEGIEFFASLTKKHEPLLSPMQKSLYLSALGLLRAAHANEIPLLKRTAWVNDTIELLETARSLSDNKIFVVRWISGVVYAQLPDRFNKNETAIADLNWCLAHVEQAPHAGWLREVYYHLALMYHKANEPEKAQAFLKLSGYDSFDKSLFLTTPYAVNALTGHTFSPKRVKEVIPGKVFALSGYEFTEFYFIVSQDQRELIAIDAGTQPDSAQAAYEALKKHAPALPALTTVFITHAHWDHIGGHTYFRKLNPHLKIYARANYQEELTRAVNAPAVFQYFFGSKFKLDSITGFKPDVTVAARTELSVGGTRFELIPIEGGETQDGLFIYLPDHDVMFVGDFVMPYFGAPFLEEGNIEGLFRTIDLLSARNPKHLLHGHEPLTRVFHSPSLLAKLKGHLAWLRQEALSAIRSGMDRAAIHHKNLIPPTLLHDPEVHIPYLLMRENAINRLYDQNIGYWQPDLQGVDHLSDYELGAVLVTYLKVPARQLANAAQKMIENGDYELAIRTLSWALSHSPDNAGLIQLKKTAALKLKEKYQEFNPFKFILYSELIGNETPQLEWRYP